MPSQLNVLGESKPPEAVRTATVGELTPDFIDSLRQGYRMTEIDRARHNAVTSGDISELSLNREVLRGDDGLFSHRIRTKGITHQKQSGCCWMFAALNTLRPQIIRECGVEEFEFSVTFLQFWDKMERANLFFEAVIEMGETDFLDREWESLNRSALEDGGWWNFVAGLIEKYGVVPTSAMPETHGSSNTAIFNQVFGRLVRSRAVKIIEAHAGGSDGHAQRTLKEDALREVYRFLVINFGKPPEEFDWRYKRSEEKNSDFLDGVEDQKLSKAETFTPRSFFKRFVGRSLDQFVCLYNDPKNELNRHYTFRGASNIVGTRWMNFVNIGMAQMKEIAIASIRANEPLWFAVNMAYDQSNKLGLMHDRLFDYESLFGLDLPLGKADRARFHAAASNHAMTLMGVDLDKDDKPKKWLVENSWGVEKGKDGWWTLHDSWFDEHVYTIIVHKRHVAEEILKHFDEEAAELPAWYPGAPGVN
jgi:bleomycin hydrolase